VLQKLQREGSYSTLATLRFTQVDEHSAQATLLTVGDSCLLLASNAQQSAYSFPLEQAAQFERDPICLPSLPRVFSRAFHRCLMQELTLHDGDCVVLATDAVAKWLVSAGAGRYPDVHAAMQVVAQQQPAHWPAFIDALRASGELVDDDSTALVLLLHADGASDGVPLGTTRTHSQATTEQRRADLLQAWAARDSVQVAQLYGDGTAMRDEQLALTPAQVQHARTVADALQEVLAVLRYALSEASVPVLVEPVWHKHQALLQDEPCAEQLRSTLTRLGIDTTPHALEQGGE
jgi:hypothetical protein